MLINLNLYKIQLFILIVISIHCRSTTFINGKCLGTNVMYPKYTHYESRTINLTLATTSRISHQLATLAFKIILEEVLGYQHVQIVYIDDNHLLRDVLEKRTLYGKPPNWMINLEAWIPTYMDTNLMFDLKNIKDFGNIGPPGRFGWFIPKHNDNVDIIHWTLFKNDQRQIAKYDVRDQTIYDYLIMNVQKASKVLCENCTNGVYIPDQCQHNTSCGMMLASRYEDTAFIINHIETLKLYLKVMWFDSLVLYNIVKTLKVKYITAEHNIIVLDAIPSVIIHPEDDYISVTMPTCNVFKGKLNNDLCNKYELQRLVKLGWGDLEKAAPTVFNNLPWFTIRHEEYQYLFAKYLINNDLPTIACEYVRGFKQRDFPATVVKDTIYIGGIFPLSGQSTSLTSTAYGIRLAAEMAIDTINKNSEMLNSYNLQLMSHDGQCESNHVLKAFIDIIQYVNLLGILGPACSDTVEPLAGVSKLYNTLTISYSAEGVSFTDRTKYAMFYRTIGENQHYNSVYAKMFELMKWKRIVSLTEDGHKYTEYLSLLKDLTENKKFPRMNVYSHNINEVNQILYKYLYDIQQQNYHIIILDVTEHMARLIMCQAYYLNMTAHDGYVWFLPYWYSNDWYNITAYNYHKDLNNTLIVNKCSNAQMLHTINGYLTLTHSFFGDANHAIDSHIDNIIFNNNISIDNWVQEYNNRCKQNNIKPSNYAGYAYDAVWTYALALNKLLQSTPDAIGTLHSDLITNKLIKYIKNIDFYGISGRIKFDNGGSRYSIIKVIQWMNHTERVIGEFYPNYNDLNKYDGRLKLNNNPNNSIVWLNKQGRAPTDGSIDQNKEHKCLVDDFAKFINVECDTAIIVINILGFSTLSICLGVIIYIFKRKYEQKVLLHQKLLTMQYGLTAVDLVQLNTLDKWEMSRENVVINRKLGQGAFGTVYGGEAFFTGKGWMPVAVKTLKVGSNPEEKLDFLSEAKVMKDFEHKNIVKLLGVCTQNEPVYTIMEFMLYGDLKTYLLGRRHLVKQNNNYIDNNNLEISNKKLTSMALDIACALSYLADIKYVHRDVACRNCLLNSQRMVKLGDFGMTRPMYENDYYRFNRRGMLPVRWMAPESLALGLFTSASDVWSYGVLLYEIVTFGSFPFQGKTNTEVLEYVKGGNVLNIPKGIKPQLEALIKSCWNLDPKRRPQASQIVEFLANSPRLLSPCLDVPISSVEITFNTSTTALNIDNDASGCGVGALGGGGGGEHAIDTNLSLSLPETFRKCSVDRFLLPPPPSAPPRQLSTSSLASSTTSSLSRIQRLRPSQKLIMNNELKHCRQQYSPSTISTLLLEINTDNDNDSYEDNDDDDADDNIDDVDADDDDDDLDLSRVGDDNDCFYTNNDNNNIREALLLNLSSVSNNIHNMHNVHNNDNNNVAIELSSLNNDTNDDSHSYSNR